MRRYFTTEVNPDYLSNELKAMKNLHQMFKAAYLFVATSFGKIDRDWCDGFVNKHSVFSEWGKCRLLMKQGGGLDATSLQRGGREKSRAGEAKGIC